MSTLCKLYPLLLSSAVAFLGVSAPVSADSESEAATEQVQASLLAATTAVHPGDEILIGVQQRIIPHWHTYWKNPGDSGLPTKIQYQLPTGTTVGEIQWPTPSKIVLGTIVNFGYSNHVTLISSLHVAADAEIGADLPIKAKVKWLVCEESCIPQQVELALRLPIVAKDVTVGAGAGSALLKQAQAELPVAAPWSAELLADGGDLLLRLSGDELPAVQNQSVVFFPEQWGPIVYGSEQLTTANANSIELRLKPGDQPLASGQTLNGVLAIGPEAAARGYQFSAKFSGVGKPSLESPATPDLVLSSALLLALLGGVILNLMPCVFPVLSIKALAVLQQAGHARRQTRLHGWAYTAGVLVSFAALAGVLLLVKAGGASIGWGFQFQTPLFVLCLAYIMFAVGLSLSGVFTLGDSLTGIGSGLAARSGYTGSFFTGALAAVVATPCTAPFMGAAIGFALSQPGLVTLEVFLSLGVGLALPYWLLCHLPALQRCLPKPGIWMLQLKQCLAFLMYAAATWLIWVLARQAGPNAVAVALGGCVIIGFAAWLYQISRESSGGKRRLGASSAGLVLVLAMSGSYFSLDAPAVSARQCAADDNIWQAFSADALQRLRAEGKPVFVNLTADWCISCLFNERVALSRDTVLNAFRDIGVVYLKGDWTNRDPAITQVLAEYGRSGVPLYLYFAPGAQRATVLPQILTPDIVINAITAVKKL